MKKLRFAIATIILAAIFHFVPLFNPAEAWVVRGLLSVGGGLRSASLVVGIFFRDVGRVGALEKENADFEAQILDLKRRIAVDAALLAENKSLKGLLAFHERTDFVLIPANIIGADPDPTIRALVLDIGSETGIVIGDPVIVGEGVLVGKIARVSPGRSTVLLPADPRSAIAVMAAAHPEADGVAQGEKGLAVDMILIPQRAAIGPGDPVVTTGRENRVPAGLLLGEVESIRAVPSDPFMSAAILPAIDPSFLTKVAVIHQE